MAPFWYLCANSGNIKYAGKFTNWDECEEALKKDSVIWIWQDYPPKVEGMLDHLYNRKENT